MSRYDSFLRLAQRVYHRLPVSEKIKWRLRSAVLPALLALRHPHGGFIAAIRATFLGARTSLSGTSTGRDAQREIQIQRLILDLAHQGINSLSYVIAIPFLGTGGAENVAQNFARAVRQLRPAEQVLIVITDRDLIDKFVLPIEGVYIVELRRFVLDNSYAQKQNLLEDLLVALRPAVFHNINSEVAWQLILGSGSKLSRITKIFASIFAFQFADDQITKIGYAAYFLRPGLPWLTALLTDNKRFVADACAEYKLSDSASKLITIYNPSRVATGDWMERATTRISKYIYECPKKPAFLWAGRLDAEKRIDLLVEIVSLYDAADFFVYGQSVVDAEKSLPRLKNLHVMGSFSSPQELVDQRSYHGFIFTSKWEGLPNILLEIGALGVPIIAPDVGGVAELITTETGYLLSPKPSATEYIKAIEAIVQDPVDATRRATKLVELISTRHTWNRFVESVERISSYGV